MELPHIGLACQICNRNDYLPFKCTSCTKIVCIDHRANHGDECPLNRTSNFVKEPKEVTESLRQACDFCRKITLRLELSKCDHCSGNHCLYHRHQAQHDCPQIAQDKLARDRENDLRTSRQREALERLRAIQRDPPPTAVSNQATIGVGVVSSKNMALAKRVRLMKMRQSASCPKGLVHDTSVREDQDRLYLEVKFVHEPRSQLSAASQDGKSVNIWTSPKWTVGQTIDYPAHLLGLINKNHIEGSDRLTFKRLSSGDELVGLDSKMLFQKYLDTNMLESGDVLYLTYDVHSHQSE